MSKNGSDVEPENQRRPIPEEEADTVAVPKVDSKAKVTGKGHQESTVIGIDAYTPQCPVRFRSSHPDSFGHCMAICSDHPVSLPN